MAAIINCLEHLSAGRQMQFELGTSHDGSFVTVKVTCIQGLSLDTALRFTNEYTRYGQKNDIRKCLIDMQGIRSTSGVVGQYRYAYSEGREAGLGFGWKIALVKDADDKTPDFFETVMLNAGHDFRLFDDRPTAISWLES